MPWLEERTLTLFVRDTEVRRYEPGVRERGVDVERPSGPLMGSADIDADTDTDPDRTLSLKAPIIHGHLIRQHLSFFPSSPSSFFPSFPPFLPFLFPFFPSPLFLLPPSLFSLLSSYPSSSNHPCFLFRVHTVYRTGRVSSVARLTTGNGQRSSRVFKKRTSTTQQTTSGQHGTGPRQSYSNARFHRPSHGSSSSRVIFVQISPRYRRHREIFPICGEREKREKEREREKRKEKKKERKGKERKGKERKGKERKDNETNRAAIEKCNRMEKKKETRRESWVCVCTSWSYIREAT